MNINKTAFHLSARRVTRGAALAEATELAKRMENSRNIVLLPPKAGDQREQVSDNEKLAQVIDSAFEPAGTLLG